MATQHVIGSSNPANHLSSTGSHSSSSSNIVGVHYKVGKKIGEGSFGVIFEGALDRSRECSRRADSRNQPAQLADGSDQVCEWDRVGARTTCADAQEPRKSDAPQLRDEYRSYKILSGCRE
jgi:casein kinase 1